MKGGEKEIGKKVEKKKMAGEKVKGKEMGRILRFFGVHQIKDVSCNLLRVNPKERSQL